MNVQNKFYLVAKSITRQPVWLQKGSPLLPTPTSLKGKRVGVQQGTIQETYAKTYWAPKGVSVVPYPTQDLIYQDMMSGRLDATLQDAIMVDGAFLKQPKGKTSLLPAAMWLMSKHWV